MPDLAEKVRGIVSNANEVVSSSSAIIRSSADVVQKVKVVADKSPVKCTKKREAAIAELDKVSLGFLGVWDQLRLVIGDMDALLYICADDGRVQEATVSEYNQTRKKLENIVLRLGVQQNFMAGLYTKLRAVEKSGKRIRKKVGGH